MSSSIEVYDAEALDKDVQPTRVPAVICTNSELVTQITLLEAKLAEVQKGDSAADPVAELAGQILELREKAKASERVFIFKDIGRRPYRDLVREHEPTDDQKREAGKDFRVLYNPETFMPALFAKSCESVRGGTASWWARKCDEWGYGQIERLWQACTAAQTGVNETPKAALAFAVTRTRDESSE